MTDHEQLVKALRLIGKEQDCNECEAGRWYHNMDCCLFEKAAAAIEELQAQLPKRGKWIEDATTYAGPGLSNYKCSLCGKICGTWRRGLEPSKLPNWCGNCGADMRAKMEVQE